MSRRAAHCAPFSHSDEGDDKQACHDQGHCRVLAFSSKRHGGAQSILAKKPELAMPIEFGGAHSVEDPGPIKLRLLKWSSDPPR
eukprot:1594343-Prorocentrum_lima.AAC.1